MEIRGERRALTGLRGVAALSVVIYHYFVCGSARLAPVAALRQLYLAVDLFFVLSGFVLALNYGELFARGAERGLYPRFLLKRAARLYPLYILVTALSGLAVWRGLMPGPAVTPVSVLANALMVQAWGFAQSFGGGCWSISTELLAYFAFPALARLALGERPGGALLLLCGALAGLLLVATQTGVEVNQLDWTFGPPRNGALDVNGPGTPWPALRCLCGFSLGMLAFRAARTPALGPGLATPWVGAGAALLALVGLATPGGDVAAVASFALLVSALAADRGVVARILASSPAHVLGDISYSVYLVHLILVILARPAVFAVLSRLGAPHAWALSLGVTFLLVFPTAWLGYALVERPSHRLARRVRLRSPARRPTAAVAA